MHPDDLSTSKHHNSEYLARINRVIDYIEAHLADELVLDTLAGVANFSPYHFHRLFRALMGETLAQYVKRVRLEKAAHQLIHNPHKSITNIAFDCGFTSSASFARAFRDTFEVSASAWRAGAHVHYSNSKNRQVTRKLGQTNHPPAFYSEDERRQAVQNLRTPTVDICDMAEQHLIYIRYIGDYRGQGALFGKLFGTLSRWAGPRGLIDNDTQFLSVYHGDPNITDDDKLRLEVCMTVPQNTTVSGEIGSMTLAGGRYAVGHFTLDEAQYNQAWDYLYGLWLPDSGYQPDDRLSFECYLNNPDDHPEHKHLVDIYVPILPL
ncbi:MAG: AraC family transcriptional regulator [Deinococcota bacterium]